jgi:DNA-directed RNA polymerase specialized sigma24 family protein
MHWSNSGEQLSLEELPATNFEEVSQECLELIAALNDPHLERVAILKFEGYTNDEIALTLSRTRRTIQRMLNLIRDIWEKELHPGSK